MPSSPATPSRPRRRSSGVSAYLPHNISQTSVTSPSGRAHSRRSSNASLRSTTTPRPASAHSSGILPEFGASLHGENGLGSLADELAEEEWDEDIDEGDEDAEPSPDAPASAEEELRNGTTTAHPQALSPPIIPESKVEYDGSEYGGDSDLDEVAGISKTLEARMADIEALARQSAGSAAAAAATDDTGGGVFERVNAHLRDLSSQTAVETGMARLATLHAAQTANVGHQSRRLTALTQHLRSPLSVVTPLSLSDDDDDLSEPLHALLHTLPQPLAHALTAAHALHECSADVAVALGHLRDSLQVTRQTTNGAARWLRSAVEAVAALRRELDEAETARAYLERHACAERLQRKEAASSCREVLTGFEEVCDSWRARLVQRAAAAAAQQVEVAT